MRGRIRRALLEGALAGLAGAVAMVVVSDVVPRRIERRPGVRLGYLVEPAEDRPRQRAATRIADPRGGVALRLVLGVACGAGYGLTVEYVPLARPGTGAVLGAVVWLAVDAWVAPLLGWPPWRPGTASAAERMIAVAPEVAYGVTTDVCLELLRRRR